MMQASITRYGEYCSPPTRSSSFEQDPNLIRHFAYNFRRSPAFIAGTSWSPLQALDLVG